MAVYVEIVQSKGDAPVKGAAVLLLYQDGASEKVVTGETGLATFSRGGLVTISVNDQTRLSQVELEEDETITIALDKSRLSKPRFAKKVRLRSVSSNPMLPANQPNQRQISLHVQAPVGRMARHRPPFNISLVIDCSNSMVGEKIYAVTEIVARILTLVDKDDRVSVVTFNQTAHLLLPGRKLNSEARDDLIQQIRQPVLGDQSNVGEGWLTGVGQVRDHQRQDALNWVLLFTDGLADAGVTGQHDLETKAKDFRQQGVTTHTFGVGHNANQPLLKALSTAGGGEFHFIEQTDTLPNYLASRLKQVDVAAHVGHDATLELTVLEDVQVTLLQAMPHSRQPRKVQFTLGEIHVGQHIHLPLLLHLPAYPAGQQICLPAALHYHDAQMFLAPTSVRAAPLCFTVAEENVEEDQEQPKQPEQPAQPKAQPTRQPAVSRWLNNPLMTLLSGGVLFLIAAFVVVGTLLFLPVEEEPPPVIDESAAQPVAVEVDPPEAVAVLSPTDPAPAPPETGTPKPAGLTTGRDTLLLPTNTPTLAPTRTPTPVPTATATPRRAPVQPAEGLSIGNIAPDFTLGSTRDSRVSLSDLRGKIVILNFWTTWCGYCAVEVPALESIHNEYGPQGVVVLAINQGEKLETVERYAWDHDIHFNVWLDEDQWAGSIYQVRGIPTTYYIDREGIIRAIHRGTRTREQFVAELEKLM